MNTKQPLGYILHETAQTVVIATGFGRPSTNPKTGPTVQVLSLVRNTHPVEAAQTGADRAVCFSCPLRPSKSGGCYVRKEQAPAQIWKSYRAGKYPHLADRWHLFTGRVIRFGAYGEPTLLPLGTVAAIAEVSSHWLGYSHQWKKPSFQGYRQYFMASCSGRAEAQAAQAAGWRTFTIIPEQEAATPGEILCPNEVNGTQCYACGLCSGTTSRRRSVVIHPHGTNRAAVFQ
jgi:hypothetical protein